MSFRTLSNPSVVIQNETIAIIPNSLSFKIGSGDKEVKAQSAGGGSIEVVVSENAETMISMVKFKLFNTAGNLQRVKDWSVLFSETITLSDPNGINESFRDMVVTTEPERSIGADGDLEIEWKGAPSF